MVSKKSLLVIITILVLSVLSLSTVVTASSIEQRTVNIPVGGTFTVHLEQNDSTEYKWSYFVSDSTVVQLVKSTTRYTFGDPNDTMYVFKGVQQGITIITFTYSNPSDSTSTHNVVVYVVKVGNTTDTHVIEPPIIIPQPMPGIIIRDR